jgi:hypothetical protein
VGSSTSTRSSPDSPRLQREEAAGHRNDRVFEPNRIEEAIQVNSVHPHPSDAPFRQLHHYALLFHDEMLETLVLGIESRLVTGTMGAILEDLVGRLAQQPYRAGK